MVDDTDPVADALQSLTTAGRAWPDGAALRHRARRRRSRRRLAAAGGTVVAAAVAVSVVAASLQSTGAGHPTASNAAGPAGRYRVAIATQSLPGDTTHLVADVVGHSLPAGTSGDGAATAEAESAFGLALTQHLAAGSSGNVVDSPLSAAVDLSMLELGARGSTESGIADALRSSGLSATDQADGWARLVPSLTHAGKHVSLDVANSAWLQKGVTFRAQYLAQLAQSFGDNAYQADFAGHNTAATDAINAWVDKETAGRIRTLYRPRQLDPATILVLADALHFKAAWASDLGMENSREPFHTAGGRTVQAPAITDSAPAEIPAAVTSTYRAVALPYAGARYEAQIIEPTGGSVTAFLAGLTPGGLGRISSSLHPTHVDLTMPSLSLTGNRELKRVLSSMGMVQAFGAADLSGISAAAVSVGSVVQATRLIVNRDGTDASAATGISAVQSAARNMQTITIDRPYLFLLRDKRTGVIVMSAVIQDPTSTVG